MSDLGCSIPSCDGPVYCKGLCRAHYRRLRRHGDPLGGRTPDGKALEFFQSVVLPYDSDDCLIWPFPSNRKGYAAFWYNGCLRSVHHVACEHRHGPAPTAEHEAAHECGNGNMGCVNPHHLRWATSKENKADSIAHGTYAHGERSGRAKLTEADVRKIRAMSGTQKEIAARFGVADTTIRRIKSGRNWRHITEVVAE